MVSLMQMARSTCARGSIHCFSLCLSSKRDARRSDRDGSDGLTNHLHAILTCISSLLNLVAHCQSAESEGSFMQLDQLLSKSEFPTALLGPNGAIGSASAYTLCDKRDGWNEPVVRLSDEKVLTWLRQKVERMRHALKKVPSLAHHYSKSERQETAEQEGERLEQQQKEREETEAKSKADAEAATVEEKKEGESATAVATTSSTASSSASPVTPSTSSYRAPAASSLKMSLQFLSSYLTPATFLQLLASYHLAFEDVFEKKRAAATARAWESTGDGKISGDVDIARGSSNANNTSDDKKRKAEKISVTAKKLATAAKGTKSLASFFGAAPKKTPTA